MYRYFLIVSKVLLFFTSCVVVAQPMQGDQDRRYGVPGEGEKPIKGKIMDGDTGEPLEFATVSLFNLADSSLVTGSVTDAEGGFNINAKPGNYYLRIDYVSYDSKYISDVKVNNSTPSISYGEILLASDTEMLDAIEIVGERSHMEMSLDKRVFNVGSDLANIGGSAADLLENVPSLTVDVDGNVSLRGNGNVRVLVNGKPSALTGISSAEALKAFPANLIERVEVITNPSVRYDAEGMSGIINIILKEEERLGWNGNIDFTAGTPESYNASFNLNYRQNKINWFANYSFRYRERLGKGLMNRTFYGEETQLLNQVQEFNRSGHSHGFRFGADMDLNEFNSVTTSLFLRPSEGDMNVVVNNNNFDGNNNLISQGIRRTFEDEDKMNLDFNLSYRKKFAAEGRLLSASFKYGDGTEEESAAITENAIIAPEQSEELLEVQRTGNIENQKDIIAQVDYEHPFANDRGKFELGYKSGIRSIGNRYKVEELIEGVWQPYSRLTDDFLYEENIQAAYGLVGVQANKFSYQVGVRAEMTMVNTDLKESGQRNEKQYLNFFPTGHFSYELKENSSMQLSYSRRIRRPRFWDLNPFFNYVNDQNIRSGNPDLNPEMTHSMEYGFINNWDRVSLTSSVYYRYTSDVIQRIQSIEITDERDTVSLSSPQNLSVAQSYGLELVGSYELTSWWNVDGSVNFFRQIIDGGNLGPEFASDNYSWFGRVNSKFKLNNLDIQTNFNYRAPRQQPQGRSKAVFFMDFGMTKDLMADKATISLRVRDVFSSRKWRNETYGDNFFIENEFQWNARQIMIGFNYRINQKKKRSKDEPNHFDGGGE